MNSILLLSDIHGNLPALDAVLEDARQRGAFSAVWVLGDSVGYGAQPNDVINRLRELPDPKIVKGNHEAAALGEISVADFNPAAAAAALWTSKNITEDVRRFLSGLPNIATDDSVTLCHGTPRDPIWEYLLSVRTAEENLTYFTTAGCIHGHTHVPSVFGRHVARAWDAFHAVNSQIVDLEYTRWFVNPGSVGQPRDGDPRASYAVLQQEDVGESFSVRFHRVEYNVLKAQNLIIEAGLPLTLAFRLSEGR